MHIMCFSRNTPMHTRATCRFLIKTKSTLSKSIGRRLCIDETTPTSRSRASLSRHVAVTIQPRRRVGQAGGPHPSHACALRGSPSALSRAPAGSDPVKRPPRAQHRPVPTHQVALPGWRLECRTALRGHVALHALNYIIPHLSLQNPKSKPPASTSSYSHRHPSS
jgi:hypothetical protein